MVCCKVRDLWQLYVMTQDVVPRFIRGSRHDTRLQPQVSTGKLNLQNENYSCAECLRCIYIETYRGRELRRVYKEISD